MKKEMIREYAPEDIKMVKQCIYELLEDDSVRQPYYWQTPEKAIKDGYLEYMLRWVSKSNGKFFVAEIKGIVVGYIIIIIDDDKDSSPCIKIKHLGYILDFVVLHKYRKQGIGKKLLDSAEQYLKSQNCGYVSLDFTTGNPAFGFYKKYGYKECSTNMKKKLL